MSHQRTLSNNTTPAEERRSRSMSRAHRKSTDQPPRSPSPPSQTHHAPSAIQQVLPTSALVEAVAGAAHGSSKVPDTSVLLQHRHSSQHGTSHTDIKADHHVIMEDLKELFCCRPTPEIFTRSWSKDAVFEDPIALCRGFKEYAPQWYAMPKLFSKSEQLSCRVMSSTRSPNRVVYAQTQEYHFKKLNSKKIVESVVVVELDENDKIIRLVDQWDGKGVPNSVFAKTYRRLNARVVPWLVKVPE